MTPDRPCALTDEVMAQQQAILEAEVAARLVSEDELVFDPEGAGDWWDQVAAPETPPGELGGSGEADPAVGNPPVGELFPVGVLGHSSEGPGGAGFASGSVLDGLEPGPVLAGALEDACGAGLAGLPDDELAGVVLAWRRCESRAVAGLLAASAELCRRRLADPDPHVGEHAADELAVLLTLTGRSAAGLLEQALEVLDGA